MSGVTTNGWPYVTPDDHPLEFPAHSQALANKLEALGGWQAYTPTAAGATFSAVVARYARIGKTVHLAILATVSSVTGNFSFSLPLPLNATSSFAAGSAVFFGSNSYLGIAYFSGSLHVRGIGANGAQANISATYPFTWASGNVVSVMSTYETTAA